MKFRIPSLLATLFCVGCSARAPDTPKPAAAPAAAPKTETVKKITEKVETTPDATSTETTFDGYKTALAKRITEVNSIQVHTGRPQALLRAVIVLKYWVDRDGKLVKTEIARTNRDHEAETIAMSTLKKAAPFPKPRPSLLREGKVEIAETWLFNNDGRFQLRSVAQQQMNE
ncbi:hypothetical protein BH11PSE11_BH11PSE11_27460 [soil metagenome]